MITLHHLEYSQSFRVLWLLEELGIDYELKLYERDKKTLLAPDDYKAVSPLGTAPVITDGELNLAETSAIIDYILDRHPESGLRPQADSPSRARYLFWYHAAQGSLMPLMLTNTIFLIMEDRVPFFLKAIISGVLGKARAGFLQPRIKVLLQQAECDIAEAEWFGGDQLTAADIVMSYPMDGAESKGFISDQHPNCKAWLQRIKARPAYQQAMQKDGRPGVILPL